MSGKSRSASAGEIVSTSRPRARAGPDLPPEEEPLVAARGDAEAPDLVPVLGGARLRLEAPVEADRVLPHAHDRRRRVEVRHHPRGVPRRPAGELALVEEQHVGPSLARQVVGDAAARDAAADDHDPCLVLHTPPRVGGHADDRSILPVRGGGRVNAEARGSGGRRPETAPDVGRPASPSPTRCLSARRRVPAPATPSSTRIPVEAAKDAVAQPSAAFPTGGSRRCPCPGDAGDCVQGGPRAARHRGPEGDGIAKDGRTPYSASMRKGAGIVDAGTGGTPSPRRSTGRSTSRTPRWKAMMPGAWARGSWLWPGRRPSRRIPRRILRAR